MDESTKQEIIKELTDRGARLPCPRCGNNGFTLLDGYFNQSVQPEISGTLTLGGPSLPSVAAICSKCGFISHHAAGVLELIPTAAPPTEDNEK